MAKNKDNFIEVMSLTVTLIAIIVLVFQPNIQTVNKILLPLMAAFLSGMLGYLVAQKLQK